nr:hypothetical protein [uncultured Draconibacterium sp.]
MVLKVLHLCRQKSNVEVMYEASFLAGMMYKNSPILVESHFFAFNSFRKSYFFSNIGLSGQKSFGEHPKALAIRFKCITLNFAFFEGASISEINEVLLPMDNDKEV